MKKLKRVVLGISLLTSMNAVAQESNTIICENGPREEMGDSYFSVQIDQDGVQVGFWESGYTIDYANIDYVPGVYGGFYLVKEHQVEISGEGETWYPTVKGTLVYRNYTETLSVALTHDNQSSYVQILECAAK